MTTSNSEPASEAVLVAGGRGFVGSHVVRALATAGFRPVLFGPPMAEDRLSDLTGRYDEIHGSVEDQQALVAAFAKARPAVVVSCVAHGAGALGLMRSGESEADTAFTVNVLGHRKLLEVAAATAGVRRVVWTSSTVVYGPASLYCGGRVGEEDRTAPTTIYGLTKELAETVAAFEARRHGLQVTALRLPLVLGPGLWYRGAAGAIMDFLKAAGRGDEARISFHDQPIDLMHVADVADAVLRAVRHEGPLERSYNLKGFEATVSELIAEARRFRPAIRVVRDVEEPGLLFPLIDGRRFSAATGFSAKRDLARLVYDLLQPDDRADP